MDHFTATTDPVFGSVAVSAIVALIPLLTFFVLLAFLKVKAHFAGGISLLVAIAVAIWAFKMPAGLALLSATQGAVFGAFPVVWIVIMAIWLYQITVVSGRFEDLRRVFDAIGGGDVRIQAILVAFCFGGLLEALAGFGAPVAITATMLVALGLKPMKAAAAVLVANTAPVAFGAMAIPITTAANLTGLDADHLGAVVGRQAPLLAVIVPLILIFILDGFRGIKETWPAALVTGVAFAGAQVLCSTFFSYELTDIVAALAGLGAAVVFLRFWQPRGIEGARVRMGLSEMAVAGNRKPGSAGGSVAVRDENSLTASRTWLALFPYFLVIIIFGIAKLWKIGVDIPAFLASTDIKVPWPILHERLVDAAGEPVSSTIYTFNWLSTPGTLLLITGLIVSFVYSKYDDGGRYRMTVGNGIAEIGRTVWNMRWAGLTILSVLSLAYVMNFSGQTVSIGTWLAGTGAFFAFLSPVLGWVGTAVTGSDTSANALFARLQQTAGLEAGIDPNLLVAANTTGGVVGKLISPQNLAIAVTAVKLDGQESVLLRKVVGWSVALLLVLCTVVFLQSTPVLGWMLP
ncbi:L-lactate permease [Arthrobacter caoxuetaonis]|uniref:L-lactate permease n=1 Tax=Arthrobacter caoxuetaonis TaxID=2886935 RepID=A0A9X1MCD0_9MICC|nr:L-lactate permease [Arthrobacter caoxuetaonis]MCC3282158.1 L-lactate permease [Arthrobacter caoxuetaonis]MCC3297453.1 L-lactate permease [Arthrobacter caoxuetaonis]USQ58015.1 L-lactate permease [Arthrobacter caoxuetaonis]